MNKPWILVFALLLTAHVASAQTPPAPGLTLLGAGASTCAKYLADTQSSQTFQAVYSNWALGYLTALNIINAGKGAAKTWTDAAGVDMRLKAWCASNMGKTYSDGVTEMAVQYFR